MTDLDRFQPLVYASFQKILPIAPQAADLFYGRLFQLEPRLQSLFSSDMNVQKKRLMQTLAAAVNGMGAPGEITPALRDLGARHMEYGVTDDHYDVVGMALMWTLEQGLGEHFTDEVKAAWRCLYTFVSAEMKAGASEAGRRKA